MSIFSISSKGECVVSSKGHIPWVFKNVAELWFTSKLAFLAEENSCVVFVNYSNVNNHAHWLLFFQE